MKTMFLVAAHLIERSNIYLNIDTFVKEGIIFRPFLRYTTLKSLSVQLLVLLLYLCENGAN